MLKFLKLASISSAALIAAGAASAEGYGLGRPALPEEIAAWDTDVRPDGLGLPEGSGSVMDGEPVYTDKCASCHGDFGEAVGRWPALIGGEGTLARKDPVKTVGSYWPYLSTGFDYIHRAMPFPEARSLSADETYAILAYVLYLNDLVGDDFVLSKENFLEVKMPNADGFIVDDRAQTELPEFSKEPCMANCKPSVEITKHAALLDVTPGDDTDNAPVEVAAVPGGPDPALVAAGETVFKKCIACHKVGDGAKNATGPVLNGIVGRTAGTFEGYKFSSAMIAQGEGGLIWTHDELASYLENPRAMVKGTKMSFAGLKKEEDRAAVIAYLESLSE